MLEITEDFFLLMRTHIDVFLGVGVHLSQKMSQSDALCYAD